MSRVNFLTYEIYISQVGDILKLSTNEQGRFPYLQYISQVGDILKLSTNEQAVHGVDFLTYGIYITSW